MGQEWRKNPNWEAIKVVQEMDIGNLRWQEIQKWEDLDLSPEERSFKSCIAKWCVEAKNWFQEDRIVNCVRNLTDLDINEKNAKLIG